MKKVIPWVIILLIFSTFTPMTIGNRVKTTDSYKDKLDFYFSCYDNDYSSKSEYYERYSKDKSDSLEVEHVEIPSSSEPTIKTSNDGPMNSPWPMFGHDARNTGRSPYSTADNPYKEKWKFRTDNGIIAGATIDSNGTIYFGGSYAGLPYYIYALHPNGTVKWKYKTGGLTWSSPAIGKDGTVYATSYDDYLHAINPDGTRKWRFCAYDSITSSPAIAEDGTIYFGTMGSGCSIYAVNENGTEKWHYSTGYYITSDPAIGDDGTIYIGSGDTHLYALYPNGTLRWKFKTSDYIKGPPSISNDGTVYIGSFDGYLYAINPNGTMKWKCGIDTGTETNPSIDTKGVIYVGGDKLYAIYPNGTMKWSFNLGSNRVIYQSSPAISADGTIYVGTVINPGINQGGELIAVNPNGTERWRSEIIANFQIQSSPSIGADGTIYIGSYSHETGGSAFGYLHAFGKKDLEADANGPYIGLVNQSVEFIGYASGGYTPYSWRWDFGDNNISTEQNPKNTYTKTGNYTVTLTVTDSEGNTSNDTTWALISQEKQNPSKPKIDGPHEVIVNEENDFRLTSTDLQNDDLYYKIEYADIESDWFGPYPSGESTVPLTFTKEGAWELRVKAKDEYDHESEWSDGFPITVPKNKPIMTNFESRFPRFFNFLWRGL